MSLILKRIKLVVSKQRAQSTLGCRGLKHTLLFHEILEVLSFFSCFFLVDQEETIFDDVMLRLSLESCPVIA